MTVTIERLQQFLIQLYATLEELNNDPGFNDKVDAAIRRARAYVEKHQVDACLACTQDIPPEFADDQSYYLRAICHESNRYMPGYENHPRHRSEGYVCSLFESIRYLLKDTGYQDDILAQLLDLQQIRDSYLTLYDAFKNIAKAASQDEPEMMDALMQYTRETIDMLTAQPLTAECRPRRLTLALDNLTRVADMFVYFADLSAMVPGLVTVTDFNVCHELARNMQPNEPVQRFIATWQAKEASLGELAASLERLIIQEEKIAALSKSGTRLGFLRRQLEQLAEMRNAVIDQSSPRHQWKPPVSVYSPTTDAAVRRRRGIGRMPSCSVLTDNEEETRKRMLLALLSPRRNCLFSRSLTVLPGAPEKNRTMASATAQPITQLKSPR